MPSPKTTLKQLIVQDMIAGFWKPGDRLTLNELAARYQASHTPIREALRELYGEGFLETGAGKTFQFRTLTTAFIENIFDIRSSLEVMLARAAANQCRATDILHLEAINTEFSAAVSGRDFETAIKNNCDFHQKINEIAANPEAEKILNMHWAFISSLWKKVNYGPERYPGVIKDHELIIHALKRHDGEAVATLMGAHVIKAKYELLASIDTSLKEGRVNVKAK